jgi:NADH dehydrogenase
LAKYKVVIVGGGFGGTKAALKLASNHEFEVSLIHDLPDFRYYPTLYETATGSKKSVSTIPLAEIFAKLPINLIQDSLVDIDRHNHTISTASGKIFQYDALILALGVKTNFFNIKGLEEYSFGIKTLADAENLKAHLHQQITADNKPDLNYIVVGGGPTGIELAGVLPHYLKKIMRNHGVPETPIHVDLVEAAPRLLPRSPKSLSRKVGNHLRKEGVEILVNTAVQAETADALMINGKPVRSHTVIWTAGMTNHPFFASHSFQMSNKGKVRVDQYLQAEPGIYVLGDNADTPFSGMAETAVRDGEFIAENLERLVTQRDMKPYRAKKPIYVFAAGPNWSAVQWGYFKFYGRIGSWLKKLADLVGFHDYEPWEIATHRLIEEYESEEACQVCSSKANIDAARRKL